MTTKAKHWEKIYATKSPNEVSWTQENPSESIELILEYANSKNDSIIDIGGGDSKVVDYLLDEGFKNISVLDISSNAIQRAKNRLGDRAKSVNWIHSDVLDFNSELRFDIWHDRAAFHFLKTESDILAYISKVNAMVQSTLIISGFAPDGPEKCSGLEVSRHNKETTQQLFSEKFKLIKSFGHKHITPFETEQKFLFTVLQRLP